MLKRLFLVFLLFLIPLSANAETYEELLTHVKYDVPEGWRLLTADEIAESYLSNAVTHMTLAGKPDRSQAILVDVMPLINPYFQATNSASEIQPSLNQMVRAMKKDGDTVLEAKIYRNHNGNGTLMLYTTGEKIHFVYRINSPTLVVSMRYSAKQDTDKNELQTNMAKCFGLFDSLQFPKSNPHPIF